MRRSSVAPAALLLFLLAPACTADRQAPAASTTGERSGLMLRLQISRRGSSIFAATSVRNDRRDAVRLDPDQCGRLTEVVLARTVFQPEGATYPGSLGKVKELVLERQRSDQNPDRFAPRRVGGGAGPPECRRPEGPVTVAAGTTLEERWELPLDSATAVREVGSEQTVVRAELVEAEASGGLDFLDILPTGEADQARRGRNLRVEQPPAPLRLHVVGDLQGPSLGERFDRMIGDAPLRTFLESQPADSWRQADLVDTGQGITFKAVTTRYERALKATISEDGSRVQDLRLPGPADRTRVFERRPASLPPGVAQVPEEDDYVLTDDVVPGRLVLPSGHVLVDGLSGDDATLPQQVDPGSYPVHVTLARSPGNDFDRVALASLVVSTAPTVTWKEAADIAVDGGTAGFTSTEGSAVLTRLLDADEKDWESWMSDGFDSLTAHEGGATELPIEDVGNFVMFASGVGDGGYPIFAGLDGNGKPTRFVIDFLLLHLGWPGP